MSKPDIHRALTGRERDGEQTTIERLEAELRQMASEYKGTKATVHRLRAALERVHALRRQAEAERDELKKDIKIAVTMSDEGYPVKYADSKLAKSNTEKALQQSIKNEQYLREERDKLEARVAVLEFDLKSAHDKLNPNELAHASTAPECCGSWSAACERVKDNLGNEITSLREELKFMREDRKSCDQNYTDLRARLHETETELGKQRRARERLHRLNRDFIDLWEVETKLLRDERDKWREAAVEGDPMLGPKE